MYSPVNTVDPLTQSFSRDWFVSEADRRIAFEPDGQTVVSLDVSDFKVINLKYGHQAGDRLLQLIFQCVSNELQPGEIAVRDTADIFFALIVCPSREIVLERLNRIRTSLEQAVRDEYLLQSYPELRFGVFMPVPDGTAVEQMIEYANLARKNAPKSIVVGEGVFYKTEDYEDRRDEKVRIRRLVDAIAAEEFFIRLQPSVRLEDGAITSAEALVRWKKPESGEVLPGEFIPLLERYRLVDRIDRFVFREVCRLLSEWKAKYGRIVPISVNLSGVTIQVEGLLEDYQRVCAEFGVNPADIELELTETAFLGDYDKGRVFMEKLKDIGFTFSLDDFGKGFSSLGSLSELPVDTVKLDNSFFGSKEKNEKSQIIVKSMAGLAKALGCRSVAEGIEHPEQLEALRKTGCDIVQGFVFYKPMLPEDFERVVFKGEKIVQQ